METGQYSPLFPAFLSGNGITRNFHATRPERKAYRSLSLPSIASRSSCFRPEELGNIEKDQLMAWYDFPLIYFWKYQKYGILLSLLPLFLAIYYGFLIIKKECRERKNLRYIEKQVIFIHDLKTPLCTNRDKKAGS